MALSISPAFDCASPSSFVNLSTGITEQHASTSNRSSSPRPSMRPSMGNRSTSLRSLALNYADNNPNAIRQQRQNAVRRQCSATHLREISELVKRMIDNEEQCSVSSTMSLAPSTNGSYRSRQNSDATTESVASSVSDRAAYAFEEEGYASADGAMEDESDEAVDGAGRDLDYRKTTDWLAGRMARCSVAKDVRVRKQRRTRAA